MILQCDFEEMQALRAGAYLVQQAEEEGWPEILDPSPDAVEAAERFHELRDGELSVATLAEVERLVGAVALISDTFDERLRTIILEREPSDEEAVALYFDWARAQRVLHRLGTMYDDMHALIELMTGESPTADTAASVTFPD